MQVRCNECGFLALRVVESRKLAECEAGMREKWDMPQLPGNRGDKYERLPICFANEAGFTIAEPHRQGVEDAICRNRHCDSFTPWIPGHSPKEHREMLQLKEQRDWQERMRKQELEWQEQRRAADRQWQEEQRQRDQELEETLRQRDQARQEEQRLADQQWQEEQRLADQQWQEEQRKRDREFQLSQDKRNRLWDLFVALVSVTIGLLLGFLFTK